MLLMGLDCVLDQQLPDLITAHFDIIQLFKHFELISEDELVWHEVETDRSDCVRKLWKMI
jgi:hypothetical protein